MDKDVKLTLTGLGGVTVATVLFFFHGITGFVYILVETLLLTYIGIRLEHEIEETDFMYMLLTALFLSGANIMLRSDTGIRIALWIPTIAYALTFHENVDHNYWTCLMFFGFFSGVLSGIQAKMYEELRVFNIVYTVICGVIFAFFMVQVIDNFSWGYYGGYHSFHNWRTEKFKKENGYGHANKEKTEDNFEKEKSEQKWSDEEEQKKSDAHKNKTNEKVAKHDYFKGCNTWEDVKNRYRKLMQIYHPDCKNGDEEYSKDINNQYEILKKQMEK